MGQGIQQAPVEQGGGSSAFLDVFKVLFEPTAVFEDPTRPRSPESSKSADSGSWPEMQTATDLAAQQGLHR